MNLAHMTWKRRLAVVLSLMWIVMVAAISVSYGSEFDPFRMREVFKAGYALTIFLVFGVLPMVVGWGGVWVLSAKHSTLPSDGSVCDAATTVRNKIVPETSQAPLPAMSSEETTSMAWVLFSFDGRIGRLVFAKYWLLLFVADIGGIVLAANVFPDANAVVVISAIGLLFLWPSLAILAKRLHDRDHSFWYGLIALIPVVGLWVVVEAFFLKGDRGANRYGLPLQR